MFSPEEYEKDAKVFATDRIKTLVRLLDPKQRVEFFDSIEEGYCRHCGDEQLMVNGFTQFCSCQNDE